MIPLTLQICVPPELLDTFIDRHIIWIYCSSVWTKRWYAASTRARCYVRRLSFPSSQTSTNRWISRTPIFISKTLIIQTVMFSISSRGQMEYSLASGRTEDPREHLEGKGTVSGPLQLLGRWVGWLEWSEHGPRNTKFYFTLSYPNLHFPTNFHQNRTKIAKVSYRGGCRVGG